MHKGRRYLLNNNLTFLQQLLSTLAAIIRKVGWFTSGGLVAVLLIVVLFAELTEDIFNKEARRFDKTIALSVHSWSSPWLNSIFIFLTTIGSTIGVIAITGVVIALLAWRKHFYLACLAATVIAGGGLINFLLKQLFQRPRPHLWPAIISPPTSFSFPSGHATMALCLYGVLIFLGFNFVRQSLLRLLWTCLMLFIIFMIGLSRIYLGVHYPTDVIGGYLSGAMWLLVLLSGQTIFRNSHFLSSRKIIKKVKEGLD